MKIKYKCIYRVKVGDVIAYPDALPAKIIFIREGRGHFMHGKTFRIHTDCGLVGPFTCYGIHWYEGRRYPADKLPIAF